MKARTTGLADGIETLEAGLPHLIDINAANHVMGGRLDRDEILRAVDFEFIEQAGQLGEAGAKLFRLEVPHIQEDVGVMGFADLLDDGRG